MSNSPRIHVGRRKSAVALVHFVKGNGDFVINKKTGFTYLQQDPFAIQTVIAPLKLVNLEKKYNIICSVRGGGICAQAEAIQLGVARALCSLNPSSSMIGKDGTPLSTKAFNTQDNTKLNNASTFPEDSVPSPEVKATLSSSKSNGTSEARPILKEGGYLRRDSRIKERRKYGLKKARKAEQYSKR